jgi:hypothetical protein
MQAAITSTYPGTKLAITEYDYGGDTDISGAIAESDFLGIMGRQHIFMANHWGTTDKFVRAGIDIYRDFDGHGSTFGDVGLPVDGVPPDQAAVYAALDSKSANHLTIIAINRTKTALPATIKLRGGCQYSWATVFRLTADTGSIIECQPVSAANAQIEYTMPPLSVTLLSVH